MIENCDPCVDEVVYTSTQAEPCVHPEWTIMLDVCIKECIQEYPSHGLSRLHETL